MHNRILRFLILTAWMSLLIGCRPASDLTATATPTGASEFGPAASSTAALSGSWQTASQVVNEPYQGTFSFAYPAGWGFRSTFSTAIEFALASDPALITVGRIEAAAAHQPVPLSGDEVFIGIYLIPGSPPPARSGRSPSTARCWPRARPTARTPRPAALRAPRAGPGRRCRQTTRRW